jgi:hypothetical protein
MDFTIMIIVRHGEGLTSQLKSFPTQALAEAAARTVLEQGNKMSGNTTVLKLYL